MRQRARIMFVALAYGTAPHAQRPEAPSNDARVRQISYAAGQVFTIAVAPGYELTINLAPDEHIQTVAIGDTNAFQAVSSRRGNTLFLKTLKAGSATNMNVSTDVRQYPFRLTSSNAGSTPQAYTVTFVYPRETRSFTSAPKVVGSYRLRGDRALWPARISDDGEHVFIDWPANVDLPAIYALDAQGRESLTNSMMREGRIVIDAIAPKLVFRLDKAASTAERFPPKVAKQ